MKTKCKKSFWIER